MNFSPTLVALPCWYSEHSLGFTSGHLGPASCCVPEGRGQGLSPVAFGLKSVSVLWLNAPSRCVAWLLISVLSTHCSLWYTLLHIAQAPRRGLEPWTLTFLGLWCPGILGRESEGQRCRTQGWALENHQTHWASKSVQTRIQRLCLESPILVTCSLRHVSLSPAALA